MRAKIGSISSVLRVRAMLKRQNPRIADEGFCFLVGPPGLEPGTKGFRFV